MLEQQANGTEQHVEVDGELFRARLGFAENCFTNGQNLNHYIDMKANFLIAAVGILTGGAGILAAGALAAKAEPGWPFALRAAGIVFMLVYLFAAFDVVYTAIKVFQALPNTLKPDTQSPGMLFPLMLLSRYKADEALYFDRLSTTTYSDLLQDYANQIVEISHIYKFKQSQINKSIGLFRLLSILWIVTMMLLVAIIVLLPKA